MRLEKQVQTVVQKPSDPAVLRESHSDTAEQLFRATENEDHQTDLRRLFFFLECLCQVTEARDHDCGVAVTRSCKESSCASSKSGVPQAPGPWTGTTLWPVRNQATQQDVSGGQAGEEETSRVFTAAGHCAHSHLNSASVRSVRRHSILMGAPSLL